MQTITVRVEPTRELELLMRRVVQETLQAHARLSAAKDRTVVLEPASEETAVLSTAEVQARTELARVRAVVGQVVREMEGQTIMPGSLFDRWRRHLAELLP